ncbi:hypothetical protein TNCV_15961 [Trichonephila clavipes]|nr:hypothetical protein TNCV_15961 [Trichonephila clavipes]
MTAVPYVLGLNPGDGTDAYKYIVPLRQRATLKEPSSHKSSRECCPAVSVCVVRRSIIFSSHKQQQPLQVSHPSSPPIPLISCLSAPQSAGYFSALSGSSLLQTRCRLISVGIRQAYSTGDLFHPSDCPWE